MICFFILLNQGLCLNKRFRTKLRKVTLPLTNEILPTITQFSKIGSSKGFNFFASFRLSESNYNTINGDYSFFTGMNKNQISQQIGPRQNLGPSMGFTGIHQNKYSNEFGIGIDSRTIRDLINNAPGNIVTISKDYRFNYEVKPFLNGGFLEFDIDLSIPHTNFINQGAAYVQAFFVLIDKKNNRDFFLLATLFDNRPQYIHHEYIGKDLDLPSHTGTVFVNSKIKDNSMFISKKAGSSDSTSYPFNERRKFAFTFSRNQLINLIQNNYNGYFTGFSQNPDEIGRASCRERVFLTV